MKHIKKMTIAVALTVGVLSQSQAHATVMADAILRLIDFTFVDQNTGNTVTAGTHINNIVGTNNANDFAQIDGGAPSFFGANSAIGASLSINQACVGSCVANNDFTTLGSAFFGLPPSSQGAFADANLVDSAIGGLGAPVGADAETRATTALTTGEVGDATSNLGLLVSFDFIALEDISLGFESGFDWTAFAFVDALAEAGTSAQASTSWTITVTETDTGDLVGSVTPSEFNHTFSALNPGESQGFENQVGSVDYTIGNLTEGVRYTLNLRHTTEADTLRVAVPEPTIIALLGIGLLGMRVVARRRMSL